ncbi:DUF2125 domain-containing protein [Loktanella sp. DJP18]|uniref:DUF2125 domain-containing protein n=1 Tax=Loktanella sp. DJP18 TaxID=3409788 RepID=UPI003BB5D215
MTRRHPLRAGACITALMIAPAAHADVTAQQVWAAWQDSMTQYASGAEVTTGAVDEQGNTVTVTDFALTSDSDGDTFKMTIPQVVFTGADDGTVAITLSESVPVEIGSPNGTAIALSIAQTGTAITASGSPEDMTYDVAADQYVIAIDSLTTPEGPVTGDMRVTLNTVSGNSNTRTGDTNASTYDVTVGTADILVDIATPEDESLMLSGKVDGIASTGSSSAPADLDFSDPAAIFGGEYTAQGSYTSGPSAYIINVDGTSTMNGTSTTGPGTMTYAIGPEGLGYEVSVTDVAAELTSSEMPFPFSLSAGSYDVALQAPVAPTDAPAPLRLLLGLSDVTVNDEIWAMFDPASALSHDPATIRLDVSGAAKLDVAVMDPAQAAALAGQPGFPGEIESLTLNDLTIDAVGLNVSGTGEFTFDNTDTTTFPGMPRPEGSATFDIVGANALIDKLIEMGLIPAEQAMMPRMMLGMFAKPTGEDALQSVIEVKDGQVLANGQRIR